ncbi:methyltransferase domain-containing protein [Kitasatospora aburaviensis]
MEVGRQAAAARGARLDWREADAEALPFADGEFDTVMSCVGVMFAPHHQRAADELLRVCRPGGTVGLINWTPQGFIGQMFAAMRPYAPPPPPGPRRRPCGATRSTCACSATASPTSTLVAGPCASTGSDGRRTSGSTSRPPTGRPSPPIGSSPRTPSGWPPSTRSSTTWPPGTSTTAPWTGSTSWSPPTGLPHRHGETGAPTPPLPLQ